MLCRNCGRLIEPCDGSPHCEHGGYVHLVSGAHLCVPDAPDSGVFATPDPECATGNVAGVALVGRSIRDALLRRS